MKFALIIAILLFNTLSTQLVSSESCEGGFKIVKVSSVTYNSPVRGYIQMNESKHEMPKRGLLIFEYDPVNRILINRKTFDTFFNESDSFVDYIKTLTPGTVLVGGSADDISRGLKPHFKYLDSEGFYFDGVGFRDTVAFFWQKGFAGNTLFERSPMELTTKAKIEQDGACQFSFKRIN